MVDFYSPYLRFQNVVFGRCPWLILRLRAMEIFFRYKNFFLLFFYRCFEIHSYNCNKFMYLWYGKKIFLYTFDDLILLKRHFHLIVYYWYFRLSIQKKQSTTFETSFSSDNSKEDQCGKLFNFIFSGMHFSQAVAIIQLQVGKIKGVQVLYNDTVSSLHVSVSHELWYFT